MPQNKTDFPLKSPGKQSETVCLNSSSTLGLFDLVGSTLRATFITQGSAAQNDAMLKSVWPPLCYTHLHE